MLPIVVAVIGLTGPGRAYADGNDTKFLALLNQAGISYGNADQAVTAGKSVCQLMDGGMSDADVVKHVMERNPSFTSLDGAVQFTAIAANVYCPKYVIGGGGDKPASGGG